MIGDFCKACAAGKKGGDPPAELCVECTPGKYAEWGSLLCEDCPSGTYSNLNSAAECQLCSAGKRRTNNGVDIENGGTVCTPCTTGKYSDAPGMVDLECTSCNPGKYQSEPSATTCEDCPAGTYIDSSGSTLCKPCNEGDKAGMISKRGQADCEACPAGTASGLIPGITFCTACPGGMFQDETGKRTCDFCEAGKYQPDPEDVKPYNLTAPPPAPEATIAPTAAPSTSSPTLVLAEGETASPTSSPSTSSPTSSPTKAPTIDFTAAPTVFSPLPYVYKGMYGASQCRTCKPGTWSTVRGEVSNIAADGNPIMGKTGCEMCPLGRYSDKWGTHPASFDNEGNAIEGYPSSTSTTSGCIKCTAGKIGIYNRTRCDSCSAPLKNKKVYSSYSVEESDSCYDLATEEQMFSCPASTHSSKRSDCEWYFIDKWEDNIAAEAR